CHERTSRNYYTFAGLSARSSPERWMPQLAAQQTDLTGMHHLVVGAPQKRHQFRLRKGMRMRNRLIQLRFVQARQFPQDLLMDSIQHGLKFSLAGVLLWIGIRHRLRPEEIPVLLRDQIGVLRLLPSNAPERHAVLGKGQVAYLPGDVADAG